MKVLIDIINSFKGIKILHVFSLASCWIDTARDSNKNFLHDDQNILIICFIKKFFSIF